MIASAVTTAKITTIEVMKLDGVSPIASLTTTGTKWNGLAAGEFTPQVAALVRHSTAVRGKKGIGMSYIPFTGEGVISAGSLAVGTRDAMQTAWDNFGGAASAAGITPILVSWPPADLNASGRDIIKFTVQTVLATQRRRQNRLR